MTAGDIIVIALIIVNVLTISFLTLKLSHCMNSRVDLMKRNNGYKISPVKFCNSCRVISSIDSTFCNQCGKELSDKIYSILSDFELIKYGKVIYR